MGVVTMRIGIDLDDTIFDTTKQYKKYQSVYLKERKITEKELWEVRENRFEFLKNNFDDIFSNLKVKVNVRKTLKYLKKQGYEIYIISARSKRYNSNIYEITKNSLLKNNIIFDELILTPKEKLNNCVKNKIDIMIDNSIDVYNELRNSNIKFILYDEHKKYLNIDGRVSSWKEILEMYRR